MLLVWLMKVPGSSPPEAVFWFFLVSGQCNQVVTQTQTDYNNPLPTLGLWLVLVLLLFADMLITCQQTIVTLYSKSTMVAEIFELSTM